MTFTGNFTKKKQTWIIALIVLMFVGGTAFVLVPAAPAVLTKAQATTTAVSYWGPIGILAQAQGVTQTGTITMQVGVKSGGCANDFVILGQGLTTWDAAFLDYTTKLAAGGILVKGPFKGVIGLKVEAWDNIGVVSFQHFVDSKPFGPKMTFSPATQAVDTSVQLDTSTLPNGFHVVCTQATDALGNVGKSEKPWFFRTNQQATGTSPSLPSMGMTNPLGK